ncbi:MAG: DUF721 domain-containing protein [Pseudomonadota bacterium]
MSDRKKKKLDPVAEVLQGLFENSKSPLSEGFLRYRLEMQWPQVVGEKIGRHSRPIDINKGLLTIAVHNSGLLTELQFFRQEIITKVNTHVGKVWVKKVRFISGHKNPYSND